MKAQRASECKKFADLCSRACSAQSQDGWTKECSTVQLRLLAIVSATLVQLFRICAESHGYGVVRDDGVNHARGAAELDVRCVSSDYRAHTGTWGRTFETGYNMLDGGLSLGQYEHQFVIARSFRTARRRRNLLEQRLGTPVSAFLKEKRVKKLFSKVRNKRIFRFYKEADSELSSVAKLLIIG